MTTPLMIAFAFHLLAPSVALADPATLMGAAGSILAEDDGAGGVQVVLGEDLGDAEMRLLQVVFEVHGADPSLVPSEPAEAVVDRIAMEVEILDDAHLAVAIYDTIGEPIPTGEPLFTVASDGSPAFVSPRHAAGQGGDGPIHLFTREGDDEVLAELTDFNDIEDFLWSPCRFETIVMLTWGCSVGNLWACSMLAYCGTKALYEDLAGSLGSGYHPGCDPCEYNADDNCGKETRGVSSFYVSQSAWGVDEDEACARAQEKAEAQIWEDDRLQSADEVCRDVFPCDEGCPQDECTGCEEDYWTYGTSVIGRKVEWIKGDPKEELIEPPMYLGLSCTVSVLMDYHCACTRCERRTY